MDDGLLRTPPGAAQRPAKPDEAGERGNKGCLTRYGAGAGRRGAD